jgi:hypothetical protein
LRNPAGARKNAGDWPVRPQIVAWVLSISLRSFDGPKNENKREW